MPDIDSTEQPYRKTLDDTQGPTVVLFGTVWCGYRHAALPRPGPGRAPGRP